MRGIKKLTVFSRKVTSMQGSRLDLSAPVLTQSFQSLPPSSDGADGRDGVPGPTGRATIR